MPQFESHDDAAARRAQAAKEQNARDKADRQRAHKVDPSVETAPAAQDPDLLKQQEEGNAEIRELREKHHKGESHAEKAKAQREGEVDAKIEQRKAEMERQYDAIENPPPPTYGTNPTNITSPGSHLPDPEIGEGEP